MNKQKIIYSFVATLSVFSSGFLWADQSMQEGSRNEISAHGEMMQQNGMGMMDMMDEMESMMEKCNSMMGMMQQHHDSTDSEKVEN